MKRGIVFGMAAITVLALTACGSNPGGGASTAPTAPTAPIASSSPAASSALTIWVDDTRLAPFQQVATKFEQDKGVMVNIVQKDFAKIRDDFISQVPTGQGPDIIIGAHDWLGKLVQNGVVAPVQLGDKTNDFLPVALQAMSYNGVLYGVPYSVENVGLVVNTQLMSAPTPSTFDELITQGKTAGTQYSVLVQQDPTAGDPYTLNPIQTSFGCQIFGADSTGAYDPSQLFTNTDGCHKFAQYVATLGKEGVLSTSLSYDIARQAFLDGKAPYIVTGPWNTGDFVKAGLQIRVDTIPSAGGQPAQPFVGVQGAFVSAKSANALLANDFVVNYLSTPDVQLSLYQVGGRAPALQSALSQLSSDPLIKQFGDVGAGGAPMPSIPAMDTVWSDWGATELALTDNKGDPVQLWDQMVASIRSKIS